MKLRNKKTGEIINNNGINFVEGNYKTYKSLTEINEEWEDYEESKEYYCIDWTEPDGIYKTKREDIRDDFNKEIGNYFNTREQAEKAVEKLKAAKRLKDKGFRFEGVRTIGKVIDFDIPLGYYRAYCDECFSDEKSLELFNDLKLLFGGEE